MTFPLAALTGLDDFEWTQYNLYIACNSIYQHIPQIVFSWIDAHKDIAYTSQSKKIKDPQKKYRLGTVSKIFYWRAWTG